MREKAINSFTSKQPEKMLSKEWRSDIENLITKFCGAFCPDNLAEDTCKNCVLQRFSDWLVPKAFIVWDEKLLWVPDEKRIRFLWIPDETRMRFTYPDGSTFTYIVGVIDVTHVELNRIDGSTDDKKYGHIVLHVNQLESMIQDTKAKVEILTYSGWTPLEEAANGN